MWKKIAVSAACGAVVIGVSTAALAESGSATVTGLGIAPASSAPSSTPTPGSTGTKSRKHERGDVLKKLGNVAHASWVAKDKSGAYVTHSAIHGSATAVSATSITVKAGDGVSQTYAVTSTTKVRVRTNGKGTAGKITDVKPGGIVVVEGTGTSSLTATGVLAGLTK